MSFELIRDEIKSVMEATDGVGVVHNYERWTNRLEKLMEFYKPSGESVINGFEITRRTTEEDDESLGHTIRIYVFNVRGYYSLKDDTASENTFNTILENLSDSFRVNHDLNGTCQKHDYLQIELVEPVMFSEVLVHTALMSLTVYEELNRS